MASLVTLLSLCILLVAVSANVAYGTPFEVVLGIRGGAKPKKLGLRDVLSAFWLSLVDPGNEDALKDSLAGKKINQPDLRKGWFGRSKKVGNKKKTIGGKL